jgi:hypothetical protein
MGKNQDPGSGINITAPQHWHQVRTSPPPTVIDQPDLFTAVLSPAEKEGEQ